MKKTTRLILITFILSSTWLTAQWQTLPLGYDVALNDMATRDENRLVFVGDKGAIISSNDGGVTFDSIPSGTNRNLSSVRCTNDYCFALLGDSVLVSSDFQNWDKYKLPSNGGNRIYFYENRIGYITGGKAGEFLKSTNGGLNWEVVTSNLPEIVFTRVFFLSETVGFALSQEFDKVTRKADGSILKTTDGGNTWTVLKTVQQYYFNDIVFTSSNTGYAVGYGGMILSTVDGGATWINQNSGVSYNLNKITFVDNNVAYASGSMGTALKTVDRGNTWTALNVGKTYLFGSQSVINMNTVYLMVQANILLKTQTGGQ